MEKEPTAPDGTVQHNMRVESDSLGKVLVPADRYWGAQTQRAIDHFSIGTELIPPEVTAALALIKKAAALANEELGKLPPHIASVITHAADEIVQGKLEGNFPLHVWMSGSGTQANMNVNEVIGNRAIELSGGVMGTRTPVHPNDHVNMSQSTNDVFPSAMNVAAAVMATTRLLPALKKLRDAVDAKAREWAGIIKIGRTHLMDAVPLTLGQEFSGYSGMLDDGIERINAVLPGVYRLALGGTAVGTGLNAPAGFASWAVAILAESTGLPLVQASNTFAVQGAHDAMVTLSGALRTLAVSLMKIANDIRLLGSGPRCGLQELLLPATEPGSSIMPGKVNPTQCESTTMAAAQVMGYDVAVGIAGAGGYLEMNAYKPLIAFNVIESIRLLADTCDAFADFMVAALKPNQPQIREYLDRSLMLVTALSPAIGYDKASRIAHLANEQNLTLKDAALKLGYVTAAEFDRIVDPAKMVGPSS
jgi:fumarate hydratase class II